MRIARWEVDAEMEQAVLEALRDGLDWSLSGEGAVAKLEAAMRTETGQPHALATSSGTAALESALYAAGIGAGDEVIASPFVPGYALAPIINAGATLVCADIDPLTLNISPQAAAGLVGERTKAILAVHLAGHPVDLEPLQALARERSLLLIEDCAQAQGALYRGRPAGSFGDMAVFSFQVWKNVPAGEGGLLACRQRGHYARALVYGQHPARLERDLSGSQRRYIDTGLGHNARIHPLAAAIACAWLPRCEGRLAVRRRKAELFSAALQGHGVLAPTYVAPYAVHAYNTQPLFFEPAAATVSREEFVYAARADGIDLDTFPPPAYALPLFRDCGRCRGSKLPVVERMRDRALFFAWGGLGGLTDDKVRALAAKLSQLAAAVART
ncbi:MAG: DegT/DnrJ/EryC1/StrS family aminotransferase [Chloroflexota bacterium]